MKTGFSQKSIADALFETNYQSKIASELWLNLAGKEFRLVGKTVRLGRALDNDIVLEDKSSSRYHALISISENQVRLEDLKSRNGVKVNGRRTQRTDLKENDVIEIGDLKGIFFTKNRSQNSQVNRVDLAKESTYTGTDRMRSAEAKAVSLIEKFKSMPPKAKLAFVGGLPLVLLFLMSLFSSDDNSVQTGVGSILSATVLSESDIVEAVVNRQVFDKCLEFEDLGNFRQSRRCFDSLPRTREVHKALARVIDRQAKLSEVRYLEGLRAFDNYYFDLAIIKWQEVVLIADESSDFFAKASDGIRDAQDKKKKRVL